MEERKLKLAKSEGKTEEKVEKENGSRELVSLEEALEVSDPGQLEKLFDNAMQMAVMRMKKIDEYVSKVFKAGVHYGVVVDPKTGKKPFGDKPTIYKAGSQAVVRLFKFLSPKIREEWDVKESHDLSNPEKPIWNWHVSYKLLLDNQLLAQGDSTCSSIEWRYHNQDPYFLKNTTLKIAKKRALTDAALYIADLSDKFTQDLDEMQLPKEDSKLKAPSPSDIDIFKAPKREKERIHNLAKVMGISDEFLKLMSEHYLGKDTMKDWTVKDIKIMEDKIYEEQKRRDLKKKIEDENIMIPKGFIYDYQSEFTPIDTLQQIIKEHDERRRDRTETSAVED